MLIFFLALSLIENNFLYSQEEVSPWQTVDDVFQKPLDPTHFSLSTIPVASTGHDRGLPLREDIRAARKQSLLRLGPSTTFHRYLTQSEITERKIPFNERWRIRYWQNFYREQGITLPTNSDDPNILRLRDIKSPIAEATYDIAYRKVANPVFVYPNRKSVKATNLADNFTVDFLERFLKEPVNLESLRPGSQNQYSEGILFLADYLKDAKRSPGERRFSDEKTSRFANFVWKKIYRDKMDFDPSNPEHQASIDRFVESLNTLRDIVGTVVSDIDPDGNIDLVKPEYQNIIRKFMLGTLTTSNFNRKYQTMSEAFEELAKTAMTDSLEKLLPKVLKEKLGMEVSSTFPRAEILRLISQLMSEHTYTYFKDSNFIDKSLKGNIQACLKSSLAIDSMIKCVTRFVETASPKLLQIVLEKFEWKNPPKLDILSFDSQSLQQTISQHMNSFDSLVRNQPLSVPVSREVRDFYRNEVLAITQEEVVRTQYLFAATPESRDSAQLEILTNTLNENPEAARLRVLYSIEASLREYVDQLFTQKATEYGLDNDTLTPKLRELKKQLVEGENSLIRKIVSRLLQDQQAHSTHISLFTDFLDKGLRDGTEEIHRFLKNERFHQELQRLASDMSEQFIKRIITEPLASDSGSPYADRLEQTMTGIFETTIDLSFQGLRNLSPEEFNLLLFGKRDDYLHKLLNDSLVENEENLKLFLSDYLDYIITKFKIKPHVSFTEQVINGEKKQVPRFSQDYLAKKQRIIDLLIPQMRREIQLNARELGPNELLQNLMPLAFNALGNSLGEVETDGPTYQNQVAQNITSLGMQTVDHYIAQLADFLDADSSLDDDFYQLRGKIRLALTKGLTEAADKFKNDNRPESLNQMRTLANQIIAKEIQFFQSENKRALESIVNRTAQKTVNLALSPLLGAKPSPESSRKLSELRHHLKNDLSTTLVQRLGSFPEGFNFLDADNILTHLGDDIQEIALKNNGTLAKLKDFAKTTVSEKLLDFFSVIPGLNPYIELERRYGQVIPPAELEAFILQNPQLKNIIQMKSKIQDQAQLQVDQLFTRLAAEVGESPLTWNRIDDIIKAGDSIALNTFESFLSTQLDPENESSPLLLEALINEIVEQELARTKNSLNIEDNSLAAGELNSLHQHLREDFIPSLIKDIQALPRNLRQNQDINNPADRVRELALRFKNIRQEVLIAIDKKVSTPIFQSHLTSSLAAVLDHAYENQVLKLLLPQAYNLENYPEGSKIRNASENLRSRLHQEAQLVLSQVTSGVRLSEGEQQSPSQIAKLALNDFIESQINREDDNIASELVPFMDSIFSQHLDKLFSSLGIENSNLSEVSKALKKEFLKKFQEDFYPELLHHLKDLSRNTFGNTTSQRTLAILKEELIEKSAKSFNEIFLKDPEVRAILLDSSKEIANLILDKVQGSYTGKNKILIKQQEAKDKITNHYRPYLANEMKNGFIDFFNKSDSYTTLEQFSAELRQVVNNHISTDQRVIFLGEMVNNNVYNPAINMHGGGNILSELDNLKAYLSPQTSLARKQDIASRLSLDKSFSTYKIVDGIKKSFEVQIPSPWWSILGAQELLSHPGFRLMEGSGFNWLEDLKKNDQLGNALHSLAKPLLAFLRFQVFCPAGNSNSVSKPCHSESNPQLSPQMSLMVSALRVSSLAKYPPKESNRCFQRTWDLLSDEKLLSYINSENVDLIEKPLSLIIEYLKKEELIQKTSAQEKPSFLDCLVLGHGVKLANKFPSDSLASLAISRPDYRESYLGLKKAVDNLTDAKAWQSYLENPEVLGSKLKLQTSLIENLERLTSKEDNLGLSDSLDAMKSELITLVANELIPEIVHSNEFRQSTVSLMIELDEKEPLRLIEHLAPELIDGWGNEAKHAFDLLYGGVKDIAESLAFDNKVTKTEAKTFAELYPKCAAEMHKEFVAPFLLALQFYGAALAEGRTQEYERNRENTLFRKERTQELLESYISQGKVCVDTHQGNEEKILQLTTSVIEIMRMSSSMSKVMTDQITSMYNNDNKQNTLMRILGGIYTTYNLEGSFDTFWKDTVRELKQVGGHIRHHSARLDLMKFIFDPPPPNSQNKCDPKLGGMTKMQARLSHHEEEVDVYQNELIRLVSRINEEKDFIAQLTTFQRIASSEDNKSKARIKRYEEEMEETKRDLHALNLKMAPYKPHFPFMQSCLQKDCSNSQ